MKATHPIRLLIVSASVFGLAGCSPEKKDDQVKEIKPIQKRLHWDLFDCTLLIVERKQQNWKFGDGMVGAKMTKSIVDEVNSARATYPIEVNSYKKWEKNKYTYDDMKDPLCSSALQTAYLKYHYKLRRKEGKIVTYEYLARLWDSQWYEGAEWNDQRTIPYWKTVESEMRIQGAGINY